MECVGEETPSPNDHADFHSVESAGPVVDGARAVAGEPATYNCCVCDLEKEGGEPNDDVDWRHGGLDPGVDNGTVEVVDCLFE